MDTNIRQNRNNGPSKVTSITGAGVMATDAVCVPFKAIKCNTQSLPITVSKIQNLQNLIIKKRVHRFTSSVKNLHLTPNQNHT